MFHLNRKGKIVVLFGLVTITFVFLNFLVVPEKPTRNIDTRTMGYFNGEVRTKSPHLPVVDFSLDGRIALRRNSEPGVIPFMLLKPKGVKKHLTSTENPRVGIGMMRGGLSDDITRDQITALYPAKLKGFRSGRAFLCEKTEQYQNPKACSGKDCYTITLITRYNKTNKTTGEIYWKLVATDVEIKVKNPKTVNAKIESIRLLDSTKKISSSFGPFPKLAEPVVSGKGRLFVTRVGKGTLAVPKLDSNFELVRVDGKLQYKNVVDANLAYSVYSGGKQCDVSKWKNFLPIAYAPYDKVNNMAARFKFARYPFRDTLNNLVPWDGVLGASYPWIDKDAANLFMTTYGTDDPYYNYNKKTGALKKIYNEEPGSELPETQAERADFEKAGARTAGFSMMGFWTYGKLVHIDGRLNNADYNFRISTSKYNLKEMTRKFALYQDSGYEPLGLVRELGDSDTNTDDYHPALSANSSFLGSIENRLNYIDQMKPVIPRDVIWFFSNMRHSEELVFDDYINPHIVINAEMNGAVGYLDGTTGSADRMRHYDGIHRGEKQSNHTNFETLPTSIKSPLLFQNSAATMPGYQNIPKYGLPIGDVRLEPIAKGGVHGKGVWLNSSSGLQFKIPSQSNVKRNLGNLSHYYVSVNMDLRSRTSRGQRQLLFSVKNKSKIFLKKTYKSNKVAFDTITLTNWSGVDQYEFIIPGDTLKFIQNNWRHLGIQFTNDAPKIFIDGIYTGSMVKKATATLSNLFPIGEGNIITLGNISSIDTNAVKGWFDDFRVIAFNPSIEEKCNYARGTIVRTTDSSDPTKQYWRKKALDYPLAAHAEIQNALENGLVEGTSNKSRLDSLAATVSFSKSERYACYHANNHGAMKGSLTSEDRVAHIKNIPGYASSVRNKLTHGFKVLKYNKPRPTFRQNQFCISCHVVGSKAGDKYTSFPELDRQALIFRSSIKAQNDGRRQPMQAPQRIFGVIPKDMFGENKPKQNIDVGTETKSYIDYWVLPR